MSGPFGAGALQLFSGAGDFYSFQPTGSLRFDDADDAYLGRTFGTPTNNKKWTYSVWIKRASVGTNQAIMSADFDGSNYWDLRFNTSDQIYVQNRIGASNLLLANTTEVFRDVSSFYHIIFVYDSDNSTAANRAIVYVNGVKRTLSANPGSGDASAYNVSGEPHHIGVSRTLNSSGGIWSEFDGYQSEITFVDGQALDETDLGQTKQGVWIPKQYSGSFGNNGFYLPFNNTVTSTGQSTVLYTGTGATRSVEGMGYKPDLVWIKDRSATTNHNLSDRVRGSGERIYPNLTNASESQVYSGTDNLLSFNSDGFSLGDGGETNTSNNDYVAWGFDAGADQTATGYGCALYAGSGSRRPVTDIGFSPDLVWIKSRTSTGLGNILFDSVRGVGKYLFSSGTDSEGSGSGIFNSFDADGFTLGSNGHVSQSGDNFVAWCWDAGDTDAAANTDGTINSTVKASTANGFSVVKYTGTGSAGTVGHGLSSAPEIIIQKMLNPSSAENWTVFHKDLTSDNYFLRLNLTNGEADGSGNYFSATSSTTFSIGSTSQVNQNTKDSIAYCWHSVSGYSKIGSYTGNGSATGPTVTCGFRPAFVMIKRADSTGSWYIFDVNRDPDNKGQRYLRPNVGNAEGGSGTGTEYIDFQSNGFQIIASGSDFGDGNTSGGTYIYMAFAGGLDTIAPVNTDGSVTSRVKASDDTGFSIVRYEGLGNTTNQTIGVGLDWSSKNKVVITKNLDTTTYGWGVNSNLLGANKVLTLNTSNNDSQENSAHYITYGTNTFTTYNGTNILNLDDNYIAYCFAETSGKSKFGTFTGNGSSSGPSVTGVGFKPGLLILKNITDNSTNWILLDNKRDGDSSDVDTYVKPDANSAEVTDNSDILLSFDSDGFTLKTAGNDINGSSDTIFYMAFADGQDASFFHDESGNSNNFEPNHVNPHDVVPDNPTNNFATLNPIYAFRSSATNYFAPTLSEGNLKAAYSSTSGAVFGASTMFVDSGKWYAEVKSFAGFGWVGISHFTNSATSSGYAILNEDGSKNYNGTSVSAIDSVSDGDIVSIALDLDSGTIEFFINNISQTQRDISSFTGSGNFFAFGVYTSGSDNIVQYNFGQDSSFSGTEPAQGYTDGNGHGDFHYSVPSGYLALCTANLAEPDIDPAANDNPENYFNTVLWSGNGTSGVDNQQAISGVGFQPDFVWIKTRAGGNGGHVLYDVQRGTTGHQYYLATESTAAEDSTYKMLATIDSDGFTVSSLGGSNTNRSGWTYVGWNWLAGGTAVSNTDGDITSSVSANTEAGFSIVTWTATTGTVGHGLNSAPELIIEKKRGATSDWITQTTAIDGSNDYLRLNTTVAKTNGAGASPTATVFTPNTGASTVVAYCFHSVEGYSKIGTYTGNGSTDGSFVYTGFRPAWVLIKRTDSASTNGWYIYDNKRENYGTLVDAQLYVNLNNQEDNGNRDLDFTSNGFKPRLTDVNVNASGGSYIYLAIADQPFKYANAR